MYMICIMCIYIYTYTCNYILVSISWILACHQPFSSGWLVPQKRLSLLVYDMSTTNPSEEHHLVAVATGNLQHPLDGNVSINTVGQGVFPILFGQRSQDHTFSITESTQHTSTLTYMLFPNNSHLVSSNLKRIDKSGGWSQVAWSS